MHEEKITEPKPWQRRGQVQGSIEQDLSALACRLVDFLFRFALVLGYFQFQARVSVYYRGRAHSTTT